MVKAIEIEAALAGLPVLDNRSAETSAEAAAAAFATLADFRDGGIFTGSFAGESPWERHPKGDELVHILKGATTLTILTEDGPTVLDMQAGMLTVVPRGVWHRFHAPDGVTVLTATPQPTEHSSADDPRQDPPGQT
jgi:mannose-6-phosphate isomerase-like protein (cupin superfamily)